MTDDPFPRDDEQLSAYLAGDLDDRHTAAFERRLTEDPALAQRLDALADALVVLRAVDDVAVPDGFEQRLAQRLAQPPVAAVADLDRHRAARRTSRWMAVGTAAAVVALGAVMTTSALRDRSLPSGGTAEPATVESAAMDSADSAAGDAAADAAGPPAGPVVVDRNVAVADEAELRRRYEDVPEAAALLGVPLSDAADIAVEYSAGVSALRLGATSNGGSGDEASGEVAAPEPQGDEADDGGAVEPAQEQEAEEPPAEEGAVAGQDRRRAGADSLLQRCLDAVTVDAAQPLVPVRIESLRYRGQPAIAYLLVTATPRAQRLNRVEVWVVARRDCSTLVFQQR